MKILTVKTRGWTANSRFEGGHNRADKRDSAFERFAPRCVHGFCVLSGGLISRSGRSRWLGAVLLMSGIAAGGAAAKAPIKISYNRDIRPVLSDNCFFCHGPDKNKRKGKLRLDAREEAIAKQAIVPGKPDHSELIKRISTAEPDDLMPPPESHKKLTAAQKDLLRRWIAEGAEYQNHWAYVPPVRPPVPAGRNGIDFLVRTRLKELVLRPSPEADRRTLLRRLCFDLIGLPPEPGQVIAFGRDKSPGACTKVVGQLLDW